MWTETERTALVVNTDEIRGEERFAKVWRVFYFFPPTFSCLSRKSVTES
jgi:hypothetical protein